MSMTKDGSVSIGRTNCERCGAPSCVAGRGGQALCPACASSTKQAAETSTGRELAEHLVGEHAVPSRE